MGRPRLPLDQALTVIGLTGRFVGDDPFRPTHLRLGVGDRGVLWPLRPGHGDIENEVLVAVADMVANASRLERTNRDLVGWARLHLLDASEPRTYGAFQLALVLDDLAERLLTRPVIHGLLDATTWRSHLDPEPRQTTTARRHAMNDPLKKPAEPGAYVGHEPERMAETIPGGIGPDDERIAAHSKQREPDPDAADETLTADDRGQGATGPA